MQLLSLLRRMQLLSLLRRMQLARCQHLMRMQLSRCQQLLKMVASFPTPFANMAHPMKDQRRVYLRRVSHLPLACAQLLLPLSCAQLSVSQRRALPLFSAPLLLPLSLPLHPILLPLSFSSSAAALQELGQAPRALLPWQVHQRCQPPLCQPPLLLRCLAPPLLVRSPTQCLEVLFEAPKLRLRLSLHGLP
jgi:hypothetical protein